MEEGVAAAEGEDIVRAGAEGAEAGQQRPDQEAVEAAAAVRDALQEVEAQEILDQVAGAEGETGQQPDPVVEAAAVEAGQQRPGPEEVVVAVVVVMPDLPNGLRRPNNAREAAVGACLVWVEAVEAATGRLTLSAPAVAEVDSAPAAPDLVEVPAALVAVPIDPEAEATNQAVGAIDQAAVVIGPVEVAEATLLDFQVTGQVVEVADYQEEVQVQAVQDKVAAVGRAKAAVANRVKVVAIVQARAVAANQGGRGTTAPAVAVTGQVKAAAASSGQGATGQAVVATGQVKAVVASNGGQGAIGPVVAATALEVVVAGGRIVHLIQTSGPDVPIVRNVQIAPTSGRTSKTTTETSGISGGRTTTSTSTTSRATALTTGTTSTIDGARTVGPVIGEVAISITGGMMFGITAATGRRKSGITAQITGTMSSTITGGVRLGGVLPQS